MKEKGSQSCRLGAEADARRTQELAFLQRLLGIPQEAALGLSWGDHPVRSCLGVGVGSPPCPVTREGSQPNHKKN